MTYPSPRRLQLRRGNTAVLAEYTGAAGELTINTDTWTIFVHDGVTVGGYQVAGGATSYSNVNAAAYLTSINNATLDDLTTANVGIMGYINATIQANVNAIINAAPSTLDTLKELADAINDDPAFYANIKNYIDGQISAANSGVVTANIGMQGYVDNAVANLSDQELNTTNGVTFVNLQVTSGEVYAPTNVNVKITTSDGIEPYDWTFTNNARLLLPNGLHIESVRNFPGNGVQLGGIESHVAIWDDSGGPAGVYINTDILGNSYVWEFTSVGTITFPDSSVQHTAWTGSVEYANILNVPDTYGNIIPSANVTYSLGNITHQWKDLWVSNSTIYIGGVPITTSNGILTVNNQPVTGASLVNSDGNAQITANDGVISYTWTFETDGSIRTPDDLLTIGGYTLQTNNDNELDLGNGDDITLRANIGNIAIGTDWNTNQYTWQFSNNGNLVLPNGTRIFDIGSIGSDTSGLRLGNHGFTLDFGSAVNDWAIMSGARLIQIQPDDTFNITFAELANWQFSNTAVLTLPMGGTISESTYFSADSIILKPHGGTSTQYLEIAPTAVDGNHLHLMTGSGTELFLGDDNHYVKLANTGGVVVNTNDNLGNTAQWSFGVDGQLTLSGNIVSGNSRVNFVANSSGDGNGYSTIELHPDTSLGSDQYLIIDPTAPGHIHIRAGGAQDNSSADLILGGENSYVRIPAGANTSPYIKSNGYSWQFGTDGILTLPNSGLIYDSNFIAGPGQNAVLGQNDGNTQVYTQQTGVGIQSYNACTYYTWTFDNTGVLTFPSGGNVVFDASSVSVIDGVSSIVFADSTVQNTAYSNAAVGIYLADHAAKSIGGNVTIDGNLFVNGNISYISTNSYVVADNIVQFADSNPADSLDLGFVAHRTVNGTLQHTGFVRDATDGKWKLFSNVVPQVGQTVDFTNAVYDDVKLGNVIFGDATTQTTAWTGSAPTLDITNTNGLTTTYYPTFVESRTAGQIARADVNLTYRTDDNILGVGNIAIGAAGNIKFADNTVQTTAWTGTVDYANVSGAYSDTNVASYLVSGAGMTKISDLTDSQSTLLNTRTGALVVEGGVSVNKQLITRGFKVWDGVSTNPLYSVFEAYGTGTGYANTHQIIKISRNYTGTIPTTLGAGNYSGGIQFGWNYVGTERLTSEIKSKLAPNSSGQLEIYTLKDTVSKLAVTIDENQTFILTGNIKLPLSGNVTFGDNTIQNTAWTGSAPLLDILNTNGLTTTYYPTFVEDRTTGQIARADVNLTYRTDDNILGVGNIAIGAAGNIKFADNTVQTTAWAGNVNRLTNAANVALTWGTDNSLTSGGTGLINIRSNNMVQLAYEGVSSGTNISDAYVQLLGGPAANSGVVITFISNSATYSWTFNGNRDFILPTGGNIQFGDGTRQSTASTGSGSIYSNANVVSLLSNFGSNSITTTGNITAQNFIGNITFSGNITGTNSNVTLIAGTYQWTFANTGNADFANGVVNLTTLTAAGNITAGNLSVIGNITGNVLGYSIGYREVPQIAAGNVTLALSDSGKHYYATAAHVTTLTVPDNANVAFPVGTAITIVNAGSGNISLAKESAVSLYLAGNSTSATRTLTSYGMATLLKTATDQWFVNGTGLV